MKKFSLLVTVFILICFMLTACGTTAEDILGALTGNSNSNVQVATGSSAGAVSSQAPTQSAEDSSETSKNSSSAPIYPATSSVGKVSPSTANSQSIPTQTEPTATVLLIDRSSAMVKGGDGCVLDSSGRDRLTIVQEAVTQVLASRIFTNNDYIGVIFFGGNKNTPIEALKLTSVSNVSGISRAINMDITAIAGGKNYLGSTDWRHALEAATKMLSGFQTANNKHIFMITDGAGDYSIEGESSNISGYPIGGWKYYGSKLPSGYSVPAGVPDKCYTDYIYDNYGITTSTLNVACSLTPARNYISAIECNGATYYSETAQEIENAIITECNRIKGKTVDLPGTNVSNSSTSTSSQPSTIPVPDVSFDGESFFAPETPVPSGTSIEAILLIMQISNIEVTPSNYEMAEEIIKATEEEYNKLTPSQKAEVINYQHLVVAREALNAIKEKANTAKFIAIIDSLPEANALKNANVDAVYKAKAIYDEHTVYLSENVPNFASYQQKLMACYEKILSSIVEETYIAQDGNGNGVLEDIVMVDNWTYTETGLSSYALRKRGNDFPSVSNFFNITDDIVNGSQSLYHTYSDTKNTNVRIWQYTTFTSFTFVVPTEGTLTLYVRPSFSRTYMITSDSGTYSYRSGSTEASCVFEVEVSGTVTISVDSGIGYICAIKYSYPNLGD